MNSRKLSLTLAAILLWTVSVSARDDGGPKYKASPDIVATLPQFCWWWYVDNTPLDPRFQSCGGFYNHYCPGLVLMKEAEKEKHPGAAYNILKQAVDNMNYTLKWTAPECFLRSRAPMDIERIKFQMDLLKWKAR